MTAVKQASKRVSWLQESEESENDDDDEDEEISSPQQGDDHYTGTPETRQRQNGMLPHMPLGIAEPHIITSFP